MADIDLPVFSFPVNWADGVTERLSFLTDVLRSKTAAEQRRKLRNTPRRSIECDLLLKGSDRTFWDLFIDRLGGQEMTIPLYWDIVSIPDALVAGFSDRIDFDTSYREFQVGDLAILTRGKAQTYEIVEVAGIDAGGIDLADTVSSAWPAGTTLMPLRRGLIDDYGRMMHKSAAVGLVSIRFMLTAANPWTPATDPATVYAGLPVMAEEPNWADDLTVDYNRETKRFDPEIGLVYQADPLGRSLIGQAHRWFLPGRDRLGLFRDLLYRRAGRLGGFWLPTFKADLKLMASAGSGATQIVVEKAGLVYTGVPNSGREYIAIRHNSGTIYRKITSVVAGTTAGTEKVNLDAPLGLALSAGQVRKISFMDAARFDQDDFEIHHHAGIDGLHECSATFRNFVNTRSAPTPIHFPIPTAAMSDTTCGSYQQVSVPANDSAPTPAGAVGVTFHLSEGQALIISKPAGLTYESWSFTPTSPYGMWGYHNWTNSFAVEDADGNVTHHWGVGDVNFPGTTFGADPKMIYDSSADAYESVAGRTVVLTGSTSYKIFLYDATVNDNRQGFSFVAQII